MTSVREIKRRIKSVQNISQVTRAMQMVAASKMKKAQDRALAARPYASKAWAVLSHLAAQRTQGQPIHPLLTRRKIETVGILLITSDKGLCGAYNANILRQTVEFMGRVRLPVKLVTVGRKGRDFMSRHGVEVIADFTGELPPYPGILDITPIARTIIDEFLSDDFDEVFLAYTRFINTLRQEPTLHRLLPIEGTVGEFEPINYFDATAEELEAVAKDETTLREVEGEHRLVGDYIYEPDPYTILETVLPRFTELQIYQCILESLASEHSARMVAMRNATDNAKDLIEDLTLNYYRARQELITNEMLDIAGGASALEQARGEN